MQIKTGLSKIELYVPNLAQAIIRVSPTVQRYQSRIKPIRIIAKRSGYVYRFDPGNVYYPVPSDVTACCSEEATYFSVDRNTNDGKKISNADWGGELTGVVVDPRANACIPAASASKWRSTVLTSV